MALPLPLRLLLMVPSILRRSDEPYNHSPNLLRNNNCGGGHHRDSLLHQEEATVECHYTPRPSGQPQRTEQTPFRLILKILPLLLPPSPLQTLPPHLRLPLIQLVLMRHLPMRSKTRPTSQTHLLLPQIPQLVSFSLV